MLPKNELTKPPGIIENQKKKNSNVELLKFMYLFIILHNLSQYPNIQKLILLRN